MIINKQFLSIPPFISTRWNEIELLLSDGQHTLNIYLKNGPQVKISTLLKEELDLIFSVHQEILLQKPEEQPLPSLDPHMFHISGPFFEHNPELSDASPIPDEIKKRLKILLQDLPQLENPNLTLIYPDCSCPHCQIMNLIFENKVDEEVVDDVDLLFSTWTIEEISLHQFRLTHPYNADEVFDVSLDNPVTCSCGEPACEHLLLVLRN